MKIKIIDLSKKKPKKKNDFLISGSPIGSPFFAFNGWNEDKQAFRNYKSWFKSCLSSNKNTEFKTYINKIEKQLLKTGKVKLFCSCTGKYCISTVVREYLEKGEVKCG